MKGMIVKDLEALTSGDKLARAGHEAEKQMAFYLRRAFGDDLHVHVLHNLRFEHQGEVAQLDHLILHRSGAVIVESKSVTSSVRVNERGEWARQWNGRWTGMPSPVLQARRQADLLRAALQAHKADLLGKVIFGLKQKSFRAFMIDVVVAISDTGVIEHRGTLPDVRKADQVPERLKELIQDQVQLAHPLSKDKRAETWGVTITPEEFARVSAFLRAQHKERDVEAPSLRRARVTAQRAAPPVHSAPTAAHTTPTKAPATVPQSIFSCRHCQGADLEVTYGKYGYHFRCRTCQGNTPIALTCKRCGGKARTHKDGRTFYADCPACGEGRMYFTNPA